VIAFPSIHVPLWRRLLGAAIALLVPHGPRGDA
jgi:hypothetical protein